jgi:sarcosine oxidase subunit gamma
MAERYLRQSALAHLQLAARAAAERGAAGVALCERSGFGLLLLRGDGGEAFAAGAAAALGTAVPREPNRVVEGEGRRVLWLGPDEWLVATPVGEEEALTRRLLEALAGLHVAVTDIGETRAVIGIAGPKAREALSQGCSLDLHPRVFEPGHCAQSLLARVPVLLHQREESAAAGPSYDIYVARSMAEYLWQWLEDAAREDGVAVIEG